jgi:hypothetical protein
MKSLKKLGIAGTNYNIIMVLYRRPIINIVINEEKRKAFPLK